MVTTEGVMTMITEHLFLVAHTKDETAKGLVFNMELTAIKNNYGSYSSDGKMARSLLPLFKKIINILQNIQPSWNYHLTLTGDYAHYDIKQHDSAGLGLAIGLYNIARKINKSSCIEGITGTGMIRLDGSVSDAHGISSKHEASLSIPQFKKLVTADDISHLSQLHAILNYYHSSIRCHHAQH